MNLELTDMVRQYNEIMQDYGIVPKVGETLELKNVGEINQGMTKPILESLSPEQVDDVFSFAKTVHEALPVEADTA